MPTSAALARFHRADRIRDIRRALDLSGHDFAALLQTTFLDHGLDVKYDKAKVSRLETGHRNISFEEGVVIAALDPHRRSALWLAFGEAQKQQTSKKSSPRAK